MIIEALKATGSQSSQPAVDSDHNWVLIPGDESFPDSSEDNESNDSTELQLQDLKEEVAELKQTIEEKDSLIKNKDDEINQLKEQLKALTAAPKPEPESEAVDFDDHAAQGKIAVALYDFQAMEDFEMSLLEGEHIEHIVESDDGWWSGVGVGGKTGLFPSHFVKLVNKFEAPPPPPEIPAADVGLKAVALYDYDAAEDNAITFRQGDIITDLVSENWWRGKSPCGEIGLFPAIYVAVQTGK